jgi:3-oxoadipate enol-lactonase
MVDHRGDTCLGALQVSSEGAGRYRDVCIDPPGHGRSGPLTSSFSVDGCARCVVEMLDALSIDRAHVVGSSWGGRVGGCFAATRPDRAGALMLMCATASPAGHAGRSQPPVGVLGHAQRGPTWRPWNARTGPIR